MSKAGELSNPGGTRKWSTKEAKALADLIRQVDKKRKLLDQETRIAFKRLKALEGRVAKLPGKLSGPHDRRLAAHGTTLQVLGGRQAGLVSREESLADLVLLTREEMKNVREELKTTRHLLDEVMKVALGKAEVFDLPEGGRLTKVPHYDSSGSGTPTHRGRSPSTSPSTSPRTSSRKPRVRKPRVTKPRKKGARKPRYKAPRSHRKKKGKPPARETRNPGSMTDRRPPGQLSLVPPLEGGNGKGESK